MTGREQIYGGALYALAAEDGLAGRILRELTQVIALFDENPDYGTLLSVPSIAKADRCAALDQAFRGSVQPYLLSFLKLLCETGSIRCLKGCAREYRRRYHEDNGIVEVRAVTAVAMPAGLKEKLLEKLEAALHKTVELSCRVDPACMGGVLLELPGKQLDGTVRRRLDELGRRLQLI